ncbi:MAG: hypothetical protein K9K63_03245 [Desulfotignum sp.]|nr:hypothetical protein [Desulfotignum sp.]MCF8089194.1 hypothetical protein [Desulfotignum sp.]MCF8136304.1 hypothetical protein [Desulfotignum sp.]
MVERLKAKLKLLEKLTDAIRQGLSVEDIRKIFSSRSQLNQMKQKDKEQTGQNEK